MRIHNPVLAKLRDRVHTNVAIQPEVKPDPLSPIFDGYLLEIGAIALKMVLWGEKLHVLPFGLVGDIYWWIEFYLNEEDESELIVSLVSMPLPRNREDKLEYLDLVANRDKGFKGCRGHLVEAVQSSSQIDPILDRAFRFMERVNSEYERAIADEDRLANYLTGLGYCVMWPTEIVYDLERITVLMGATERSYYIDSIENVATAAGGIYFKDILGRGIVVSHGSGYVVEPLTFQSVAELAAESQSLVVNCVELLTGFDRLKIAGFAEPFMIYNPDLTLKIAHQFLVPAASIAESLKPILEVGGI